jgi:hypothetical protein
MGRLVEIPNCVWMRLTAKQKEEYYQRQKRGDIIVGIIVSITMIFIVLPLLLLLWGLR